MKNYWLTRKEIREEAFSIPEIPPITFPAIDLSNITPPPDINIPPIVFGCIDITGYEIPTEIKLTVPDLPPVITVSADFPPVINLSGIDWSKSQPMPPDGGLPPSTVTIDWATPPELSCVVIVRCPGTTDEEYAAFCAKHGVQP